jgi:hypothetical protein
MSFMRRAAVVAASVVAASAALVMPANAAGTGGAVVLSPAAAAAAGCQYQVSSDQHFAQTRCYDLPYREYAILLKVCDGRACADRIGPWKRMNSGQWSGLRDNATWILEGGHALR